jgi:flagellar biosynthesis/type III secretory pathway M-ring protein FliF/YscJ
VVHCLRAAQALPPVINQYFFKKRAMGSLTGGIIIVVTFAVTFGIARAVMLYRARREAERKRAYAEFQQLQKSLQPPSKNKSKRRREQQKK